MSPPPYVPQPGDKCVACGCVEGAACAIRTGPKQTDVIPCWWVETAPVPICSACLLKLPTDQLVRLFWPREIAVALSTKPPGTEIPVNTGHAFAAARLAGQAGRIPAAPPHAPGATR